MTPAIGTTPKEQLPWSNIAWFGLLLTGVYATVIYRMVAQWSNDADMSHGFFVPVIAGFIVWQRRAEIAGLKARPSWWGLALVLWGGVQLFVATLGAELFLARTALVITLIGSVWFLGGTVLVRKLAFPLFLLFFMVPIPALIYNSITFPLQLFASRLADHALTALSIPVLREGNILELPNQTLSVVEACSGIRSLLSLTFLSLVYGYFFEKRVWLRVVLFFSTVPIAILANGSRVTLTGILTEVKPELAEGFFHTASGWVIFMIGLGALVVFHRVVQAMVARVERRRHAPAE
jgi:exosortase